jgi:hypothetical protein
MKKIVSVVINAAIVFVMFVSTGLSQDVLVKNALDVLVKNSFAPTESLGKWTGGWSAIETIGNNKCIAITNDKEKSNNTISLDISPDAVAGKKVLISALIKAENVTDKPKPWNGPKLMLVITPVEGSIKYPASDLLNGTYDWKRVYFSTTIPPKVKSVSLTIGLEQVKGKVWYDQLTIEPYSEEKVKKFKNEAVIVKIKKEDWNGSIAVNVNAELGNVNELVFGNNIIGVTKKKWPMAVYMGCQWRWSLGPADASTPQRCT